MRADEEEEEEEINDMSKSDQCGRSLELSRADLARVVCWGEHNINELSKYIEEGLPTPSVLFFCRVELG